MFKDEARVERLRRKREGRERKTRVKREKKNAKARQRNRNDITKRIRKEQLRMEQQRKTRKPGGGRVYNIRGSGRTLTRF